MANWVKQPPSLPVGLTPRQRLDLAPISALPGAIGSIAEPMPFGHLQATAIDMQPGLAGGHAVGPHWAAGWMNLRASWGFRAAAKRGQHLVDDRLDVI